jgi:hypothetical protein
MPKRSYLILFVLALCVISAVASYEAAPGYMDAEYYYSDSVQLASGHGFQENFIWNYLDTPPAAPHPSHTYWMPMASLLAAFLPGLMGRIDFLLARIPFIVIGAALAPLTAALTYSFTRNQGYALLGGVLAAFPGYYLPYLGTTDTFGVYMLLGSAFLLLAASLPARFNQDVYAKTLLLGVCAGLMHLSRADGLLWLGYALVAVLWAGSGLLKKHEPTLSTTGRFWQKPWFGVVGGLLCVILGYLAVMAPWLLRNLTLYGTVLSPGAGRVMWQRSYNELFNFPPETLTFSAWRAQGLGLIFQQRMDALVMNLKSALGVQMEIVLAPFVLVGLWQLRKVKLVQMAVVIWAITLGVMSFVYPFAGARGGFFHSGTAVQPVLWAAAPIGFGSIIGWAAKKRKWSLPQATNFFAPGLCLITILLTGFLSYQLVAGSDPSYMAWNHSLDEYRQLEVEMRRIDPAQKAGVMVNNPAGYSLVSDRPAYVIPNGDVNTLLAVARRYQAQYVLMDENLPVGLLPAYHQPKNIPGLVDLSTIGQTLVFRVDGP